MVIIVNGVRKSYGSIEALSDLDISVEEGGFYALLGEAGSGKSTTIACLATLTEPDEGATEIAGYRLGADDDVIRSLIGVVLDQVSLDPDLTIRENIANHASYHGLSAYHWQDRVEELAAALELFELLDCRVEDLSDGQSRRADLVRALAHQPSILLLDEPFTGLDTDSTNLIWQVLHDQSNEGVTVVFTTGDALEAELADTVGILVNGQVVAQGSPVGLLEQVYEFSPEIRCFEDVYRVLTTPAIVPDDDDHLEETPAWNYQAAELDRGVTVPEWPERQFDNYQDGFRQIEEKLKQMSEGLNQLLSNETDLDEYPEFNDALSWEQTKAVPNRAPVIGYDEHVLSGVGSQDNWLPTGGALTDSYLMQRSVGIAHDRTSRIKETGMPEELPEEIDDWADDPGWDGTVIADVIEESPEPEPMDQVSTNNWVIANSFAETGRVSPNQWDDSVEELPVEVVIENGTPLDEDAYDEVELINEPDTTQFEEDDLDSAGEDYEADENYEAEEDYEADEDSAADPPESPASPQDQLESVSRQLTDALLGTTLPTFDEQFPDGFLPTDRDAYDQPDQPTYDQPFDQPDYTQPEYTESTYGQPTNHQVDYEYDQAEDYADYTVPVTPPPVEPDPIDEALMRQAQVKLAVERRIAAARQRRASQSPM